MNIPYEKQYDKDGKLINPIPMYGRKTTGPNRRQRRGKKRRKQR